MSGVDWEPLDCQKVAGSHRARNKRGKSHPPSQLPEMCTLSLPTACSSSQLRQNAIFLSAVCTGANPNEYYSHTSVQTLRRLQRLIKPHVAAYSSCTQMLDEALPAMTSPPCPCPFMHPPSPEDPGSPGEEGVVVLGEGRENGREPGMDLS